MRVSMLLNTILTAANTMWIGLRLPNDRSRRHASRRVVTCGLHWTNLVSIKLYTLLMLSALMTCTKKHLLQQKVVGRWGVGVIPILFCVLLLFFYSFSENRDVALGIYLSTSNFTSTWQKATAAILLNLLQFWTYSNRSFSPKNCKFINLLKSHQLKMP